MKFKVAIKVSGHKVYEKIYDAESKEDAQSKVDWANAEMQKSFMTKHMVAELIE